MRGQLAGRTRRVPLNQRRKAPSVPNPSRQTDRRARAYPENPARSATGMVRGNVVRIRTRRSNEYALPMCHPLGVVNHTLILRRIPNDSHKWQTALIGTLVPPNLQEPPRIRHQRCARRRLKPSGPIPKAQKACCPLSGITSPSSMIGRQVDMAEARKWTEECRLTLVRHLPAPRSARAPAGSRPSVRG